MEIRLAYYLTQEDIEMSYSYTIFIGRLTADPELKSTSAGVPVLSATVAVDRKYQADKTKKVADFHNIEAWRNQAQFIARWFKKGDMIRVVGELHNESYTASDGNKRYVTKLVVDDVGFVGPKQTSSNANTTERPSTDKVEQNPPDDNDPVDVEQYSMEYAHYDDELPF